MRGLFEIEKKAVLLLSSQGSSGAIVFRILFGFFLDLKFRGQMMEQFILFVFVPLKYSPL